MLGNKDHQIGSSASTTGTIADRYCGFTNFQGNIAFFGHFGWGNFGNAATLEAMLCHVRSFAPGAQLTCICTGPESVARDYKIRTARSRSVLVKHWKFNNSLGRLARKLLIGIPSELYRWLRGLSILWHMRAMIIPGTGVLTDAYTLLDWGPYDMFRWSVTAKLCGCKLMFVSVGAGPIYSGIGRFCVKAALSLADFRSYRDESTQKYLEGIGFPADRDPVYPDLAFSLPGSMLPRGGEIRARTVVGLGLMEYAGKYGVKKPNSAVYFAYLETLVAFVKWLLSGNYDVRLIVGDLVDLPVIEEFKSLLRNHLSADELARIIHEPASSVKILLEQLAATDIVVATRFHNVLLSMVLNKPALAISFHHKCSSLMEQMGMSEYCQDIRSLNVHKLIEQFCNLEQNAETLKVQIRVKVEECRVALDEQYNLILREFLSEKKEDYSEKPVAV